MMSSSEEVDLNDVMLEAATRVFTNIQFLTSTIKEHVSTIMERQPYLYKDKDRVQVETEEAMNILNLFREISKNLNKQVVQAVILYQPDKMTRNQFANYVSSAVALPLVKADTHDLTKWYDLGMPKALYEINNPETFLKAEKICFDDNIPCHIVEGSDGTLKAMGIGPAVVENIHRLVGNLRRL